MTGEGRRVAVVLFNLGGPDSPDAVRPFLTNLFSDPAIISLPAFLRLPLAWLIAWARKRKAVAAYAVMGGASPLLAGTQAQAKALEAAVTGRLQGAVVKTFVAMRYWGPDTKTAAKAAAMFEPTDVVLLPLYPQYSVTTTASSLAAWTRAYAGPGVQHTVCCWHANGRFIEAHAEAILSTWNDAGRPAVRLLFSAHGVPMRTAEAGDPYPWQVEATCGAIAARLGDGWDWQVCYQSRVGPLKWLGPSTPDAILAAAGVGLGVLIDPVSFVSEHIETLVELDRDYAALAGRVGAPFFLRAPTLGVAPTFIDGLADTVLQALTRAGIQPDSTPCPDGMGRCGRFMELAE